MSQSSRAEPGRYLDADEMAAWLAFIVAHARLVARLDEELSEAHGLSLGEYEVLVHLADAPDGHGARRMAELAERCLVSPSGLTRRLDRLVAAGLVCRRSCPTDGRGSLAVLTEEGSRHLAEAAPTHVAGVRRHLVDRLSRAELVMLAGALGRVGAGLGAAPAQPAALARRANMCAGRTS